VDASIARASPDALGAAIPALAAMLREAVAGGAGLGYGAVPSEEEALRAWRAWTADAAAGHRVVLLAREPGGAVVGTVQLDLARVENGAHRAELAKLMVRADQRGRGLGARLVAAALAEARALGRTTVWLCTVEKDAERLYARAGFTRAGEIPFWSQVPAGTWRTASFWWARLDVALRPIVPSDIPILHAHTREEGAAAMAAVEVRAPDAFREKWATILADPGSRARAILVGGALAGHVNAWTGEGGARLVGYWVARAQWGRGVATEALRLFLREETTRPLFATVAAHNAGSRRVLEKNGFVPVEERVGADGITEVKLALHH
jgi:RimJ/RimL family protein N-acetyltransferase